MIYSLLFASAADLCIKTKKKIETQTNTQENVRQDDTRSKMGTQMFLPKVKN